MPVPSAPGFSTMKRLVGLVGLCGLAALALSLPALLLLQASTPDGTNAAPLRMRIVVVSVLAALYLFLIVAVRHHWIVKETAESARWRVGSPPLPRFDVPLLASGYFLEQLANDQHYLLTQSEKDAEKTAIWALQESAGNDALTADRDAVLAWVEKLAKPDEKPPTAEPGCLRRCARAVTGALRKAVCALTEPPPTPASCGPCVANTGTGLCPPHARALAASRCAIRRLVCPPPEPAAEPKPPAPPWQLRSLILALTSESASKYVLLAKVQNQLLVLCLVMVVAVAYFGFLGWGLPMLLAATAAVLVRVRSSVPIGETFEGGTRWMVNFATPLVGALSAVLGLIALDALVQLDVLSPTTFAWGRLTGAPVYTPADEFSLPHLAFATALGFSAKSLDVLLQQVTAKVDKVVSPQQST